MDTTLARLADKFLVDDGCWPWVAGKTAAGYGAFRGRGESYAHRVLFRLMVGPIPAGHDVDHTCHNEDQTCAGGPSCSHRACVRPSHMRAVPRRENAHAGRNGPKDVCDRGHLMTEVNSYWRPDGKGRMCRACQRQREKDRPARAYDPQTRRASYLSRRDRGSTS